MDELDILKQQIAAAPNEIKQFLAVEGYKLTTEEIATKNNLSSEQKTALENEVIFVFVGMELENDLEKNLTDALGIQPPLAQDIEKELSEKLFDLFRDLLPTQEEPVTTSSNLELSPDLLPEILPGQTAHNVPHVEFAPTAKPIASTPAPVASAPSAPITHNENGRPNLEFPQSGYQRGKDPYREPLE